MTISQRFRAFLQEPVVRVVLTAAVQSGAAPIHALDALIRARFGVLSYGHRRAMGKEIRKAAEALGFQHVRAGVGPTQPVCQVGSTYA
ncbi:hypothetical protein ACVIU4_000437 [Bradyrhizobium barranii subsp. barranii]|nr:hypothetical protein [Bradyrhizobium japonicum]MCP1963341.1 hypothetical protein [Bradyrhizobium japonicum]